MGIQVIISGTNYTKFETSEDHHWRSPTLF